MCKLLNPPDWERAENSSLSFIAILPMGIPREAVFAQGDGHFYVSTWLGPVPNIWSNAILHASVKAFLDEINI